MKINTKVQIKYVFQFIFIMFGYIGLMALICWIVVKYIKYKGWI